VRAAPGSPPSPPPKAPTPAVDSGPADAAQLLERLGNAWFARDLEGYLALWRFATPAERRIEAEAARRAFAADETQLTALDRPRHTSGPLRLSVDVQVFTATEPEAGVEYWQLFLEPRGSRWAIVGRQQAGGVDGLIHLPLGPRAWRVRGVSLSLEDFELLMEEGTLFSTPESVGPTALVFVGRGRVRFTPRPPGERDQLRQFAGHRELDRDVKWAFVRLNPADLPRVLDTSRLEPEPDPGRRRGDAEKRWRERAEKSFLVDAPLPRSPWWLYPGIGDAVVDFPWKGSRVLTFSVARGEPEDVNLFERDRHLRICSYPSAGRPTRYSEDYDRVADVLRHDLVARFDPDRRLLSAVDTIHLRLLSPVSTLRLKLDDDFQVSSVSSDDGGNLLFLRVRGQDSLVVSLGPHAGRLEETSLTVRYSGRHDPTAMDHELLQLVREPEPSYVDRALLGPPPLVYSNRTAWYPRPDNEDFATLRARFDTPAGFLAVTGGQLVSTRTMEDRVDTEYRLEQPGKYFTAVVGRLEDVGMRQEGEQAVRGFADHRSEGETREQLEKAQEILAFYGGRFGPCPYPQLNLVVAEAAVPGGHSPPGLVFLQRRPGMLMARPLPEDPANFSDMPDFFLAHELAHQWWGQTTAPANYHEQWLSEAWAQYAAALWVRHEGGEDAFRDMLDRMARWARRDDEEGAIHLGQRLGHLEHDPRILRAVVYDKGAWVLHMLRELVGDEAFFRAARAFLARHRFAKAGTDDLRAALEDASGLDLRPYFERWIYGTGLPTLLWTAHTEKTPEGRRTTVEVRPRDLPGPFPLEIAVTTHEGRELHRVVLEPGGGTWTFDTAESPRRIEINDDRGLLAETDEVRRLPSRPH
jgi:Peptidase family M1 domain